MTSILGGEGGAIALYPQNKDSGSGSTRWQQEHDVLFTNNASQILYAREIRIRRAMYIITTMEEISFHFITNHK